jgi:hypothetical protein
MRIDERQSSSTDPSFTAADKMLGALTGYIFSLTTHIFASALPLEM